MKKIFTLILIFSLKMQIFSQNKIEKIEQDVGYIATTVRYENEKGSVAIPVILNAFLTLGIGSFVQGDYIGGSAVLGTQVLGGIFILSGYIIARTVTEPTLGITGALTLMGIGGLAVYGSYVAGLILPFTFKDKYNANLRKNLGISLAGFEPNFDIGINGFQLSFKKSY
ncbi:P13 family porin [Borreliella afzelii]|uniref:P13 family porin n=1 Tax=Borreliella afzelii TaxID=29518 RepID=UPI00042A42FC